jgi:hypothetical protein
MFSNSVDAATDEEIRLATDSDYIKQNPDKFLSERWQPYGTNPTVDFLYSLKNKLAPAGRAVGNFAGKHRDNAIHGHWGNSLLYGGGLGALGFGYQEYLKQKALYAGDKTDSPLKTQTTLAENKTTSPLVKKDVNNEEFLMENDFLPMGYKKGK